MPFWERHKDVLVVLAGFLGLLFLVWLFAMWGYAGNIATNNKAFEEGESRRDQYCPEEGEKVHLLTALLANANKELKGRLDMVKNELNYSFRETLPDREWQVGVRNQYDKLQKYVSRNVVLRKIKMEEDVEKLGFSIPDDYTEDRATAARWLRQMEAVRRAVDLLMSVHENPHDDTSNILGIEVIRPLAPVQLSDELSFIREYPVEIKLHIRMDGLARLLQKCSTAGNFQVVQALEILSDFDNRFSRGLNNKAQAQRLKLKKYSQWYGHYYAVRLQLATALLSEPVVKKNTKQAKQSGPTQVILH